MSSVAITLVAFGAFDTLRAKPAQITPQHIDNAVNHALQVQQGGPTIQTMAYGKVIRSVVRVSGLEPDMKKPVTDDSRIPEHFERQAAKVPETYNAVGTGVVIDEDGTILTNFHVAAASPKIRVQFWDGTDTEAVISAADPEHDLAVLKPATIPDDLPPATLTSTKDLLPGATVVAIGFPFGIGPSTSAGVVSGLKRSFGHDETKKMDNLIQFDAAANPGNSGGPLINASGEVVGIVTAILNPSGIRTFAGIGFAVPIETAVEAAGENPL